MVGSTGARNAADVIDQWDKYRTTMAVVRETLLEFRSSCPELQDLAGACGLSPSREPPSAQAIAQLRLLVAKAVGLGANKVKKHHAASTWRYNLVRRIMEMADDPDLYVAKWLETGFPVGIAKPITPSGLLPAVEETRDITAEQLEDLAPWTNNHASFDVPEGDELPAHALLKDLLDQGFAFLFDSVAEAESWLDASVVVSPLGDVTKVKSDGSIKHRLIMDLRASEVNRASVVQERQVLPRFGDQARDVAMMSELGKGIGIFILDFKNAFMSLPLAQEEMRFNVSVCPTGLERSRDALYGGEPRRGSVLVWRVLGFGGHSNPLTYSRAATFAARSGQALLCAPLSGDMTWAPGRLQLYVDDPALTLSGSIAEQNLSVDLLVAWWLCLGIPLSWDKGGLVCGDVPHDWIGVSFWSRQKGTCTMRVPKKFADELLDLAKQFAHPTTSLVSVATAHALCGKAGRLAQVVPEVRPFTTALFTALAVSLAAAKKGVREAPPNKVAVRRFRQAATWLVALLGGSPFAVEHTLYLDRQLVCTKERHIEFDASPWGAGALLVENEEVVEFFTVVWTSDSARQVGAVPGEARWQTFWEFATPRS